ncbi:MAG: Holliday junction branch migration DNA helicase RuvB [Bacilli bacterium]|nr:Holliday junction branch migration DNA helicase RuvB [Bacilli bacterium]MDD3304775.1 Holliday junction branch migration DNA helicase RuvB [Bacilli bacterium]MDD4053797.1 Holliday junction branch migration DNA helicase RuvB [Bacilli bacterium]MDD4411629.1 Holliday junction branch migration DNA helicase RuvB [Bacilli bacterium]
MDERIITSHKLEEDTFEKSIRPDSIDEYIGQSDVKENLKVFIEAAKMRDEPLDHVLLYGPPGLGKTTLAYIIANELGSNIKTASGPTIEKSGDLAAILSTLEPGDVLFIDEIHRMPRYIEEILYPAMEDFTLDIIVGGEGSSRNIKIDLPPFTLVGATTRAGDLSSPLRDRFGIISKLNYYTVPELFEIIKRTGRVMEVAIDDDAALELAKRSRGTPRIANRLFKRVRDFALVLGNGSIDLDIIKTSLGRLKVDELGLDETDHQLLMTIITKFNGGPVGIEAVASSIGEEMTTIEDVYEPYLLQIGFMKRTARGRIVTELGYQHLKINKDGTLF